MPNHSTRGAYGKLLNAIRELVFGLEDGLVSTMGAVAGIAAGTENGGIVVLSGLVIIAVEALSMAAGSYLSNKSHREMLEKKIADEREEIETKPEEETEELRVMYRQRGFSPDEVEILVRRITANKELWLEEMVAKELRIGMHDLEEPNSRAVIMGFSYVAGGAVPLLPYLVLPVGFALPVSVVATIIALYVIGYMKGRATGLSRFKSGGEMVLVASAAALIAYAIGKAVGHIFGLTV
ncbi:MAG: VIT1/CCC1 transporter family protein [Patescibacteria group bacterium]|nr:MAG: VIT1/CCC1 transporter family protein [Patescibacteria group bacterium]